MAPKLNLHEFFKVKRELALDVVAGAQGDAGQIPPKLEATEATEATATDCRATAAKAPADQSTEIPQPKKRKSKAQAKATAKASEATATDCRAGAAEAPAEDDPKAIAYRDRAREYNGRVRQSTEIPEPKKNKSTASNAAATQATKRRKADNGKPPADTTEAAAAATASQPTSPAAPATKLQAASNTHLSIITAATSQPTSPAAPARKPKRAVAASCVPATEGWTPEEQNAMWARFKRSLPVSENDTGRKSDKCPFETALMFVGDLQEESKWFQRWLEGDKQWGVTILRETQRKTQSEEAALTQDWLTYGRLVKLYKCETVASAIKASKFAGPHGGSWRRHPEVPSCPEAMQYQVQINETQKKTLAKLLEQELVLQGEASSESAAPISDSLLSNMQLLSGKQLHHAPLRHAALTNLTSEPSQHPGAPSTSISSNSVGGGDLQESVASDPRINQALALLKETEKKADEKQNQVSARRSQLMLEKAQRREEEKLRKEKEKTCPLAKGRLWFHENE